MTADLALKLDFIRGQLLHWCDWNKAARDREGITTENDTHIISVPPHWPTHGVLRRWAETIEEARKLADANSKDRPETQVPQPPDPKPPTETPDQRVERIRRTPNRYFSPL